MHFTAFFVFSYRANLKKRDLGFDYAELISQNNSFISCLLSVSKPRTKGLFATGDEANKEPEVGIE